MAWDFSTEPEFEAKLDWMRGFVREEILPLETLADVWRSPEGRERFGRITAPLKEEVKARACGRRTSRPTWAAAASARSSWA